MPLPVSHQDQLHLHSSSSSMLPLPHSCPYLIHANPQYFLICSSGIILAQHITMATHRLGRTLDLIISWSNEAGVRDVSTDDLSISDHLLPHAISGSRGPCTHLLWPCSSFLQSPPPSVLLRFSPWHRTYPSHLHCLYFHRQHAHWSLHQSQLFLSWYTLYHFVYLQKLSFSSNSQPTGGAYAPTTFNNPPFYFELYSDRPVRHPGYLLYTPTVPFFQNYTFTISPCIYSMVEQFCLSARGSNIRCHCMFSRHSVKRHPHS